MKNEDYWVEFMMRDELEMSNPHEDNPARTAFATFFSFAGFGVIPLIPYIFLHNTPGNLFMYSLIFSASALFLLGMFRWKITKQHIVRSLFETLLVGAISAGVAYAVGTVFTS
jgi:vacuolar iron transporter family protein